MTRRKKKPVRSSAKGPKRGGRGAKGPKRRRRPKGPMPDRRDRAKGPSGRPTKAAAAKPAVLSDEEISEVGRAELERKLRLAHGDRVALEEKLRKLAGVTYSGERRTAGVRRWSWEDRGYTPAAPPATENVRARVAPMEKLVIHRAGQLVSLSDASFIRAAALLVAELLGERVTGNADPLQVAADGGAKK